MSQISLTTLRQQLFKVVDRIIKTGVPVEISRRGHKLRIVPVVKTSKLARLTPHKAIVGNPEDLVEFKAGKWRKGRNL
ncbi:MAG: type II toxin-antitoxin system Phd/YefM family antitoxin [Sulfuricaulis sp.]|uniref:type II toxin-antitoxin system Phd/YefM family antitoxin n=1 Tax=Sulfuricaulis sp. TaxID=2003553 RepID=UPI0034A226D9